MGKAEHVELTVLCMVYRDDMLLLQNRVKADWQGYTLPGGHLEPGESVIDAVIREMKEETGLTIHNPRLCGIKQFPTDNGRYLVFLFKTTEFTGELLSSEEGKMEWVQRSALHELRTVNDFSQLLSVFDDDALQEFLYVENGDGWDVVLK